MPMNYAYHPGNVAHSSAQEVDDTVFPAAKTLGINLIPLEGATSCGAGIIRQANRRLQLTLNARTFAMAEELGLEIVTPCATTAGTLFEDLTTLRSNPNLLAEVNNVLMETCGKTFTGETEVRHLLHVIVEEVGLDKLSACVKNPIGFSVAGHYGPNIQRKGACGNDDVFQPNYLESVINALGGKPVSLSYRTQSVGVPSLLSEESTALKQAAAVLSEAKNEGAEMLVSICTLSHAVLDVYQVKAGKISGENTSLPVIHFTEMLAFSMGHFNTRLAQLKTRVSVIGN
jgi:succinate dehydrogenase / fumarate reductase cytochrome b subunit